MPRRERDKELARRRKRKEKRRKLRAKGFLPPSTSTEAVKETEKKKPETVVPKETIQQAPKEVSEPSTSED